MNKTKRDTFLRETSPMIDGLYAGKDRVALSIPVTYQDGRRGTMAANVLIHSVDAAPLVATAVQARRKADEEGNSHPQFPLRDVADDLVDPIFVAAGHGCEVLLALHRQRHGRLALEEGQHGGHGGFVVNGRLRRLRSIAIVTASRNWR